jgi:hypothetical protein
VLFAQSVGGGLCAWRGKSCLRGVFGSSLEPLLDHRWHRPTRRGRHVATFVAVRIRLLGSRAVRTAFAGFGRCEGFLLEMAAARNFLLALAAVRADLLALAAVWLHLPHCARSQQIIPHCGRSQQAPSSLRREPANPSVPRPILASLPARWLVSAPFSEGRRRKGARASSLRQGRRGATAPA